MTSPSWAFLPRKISDIAFRRITETFEDASAIFQKIDRAFAFPLSGLDLVNIEAEVKRQGADRARFIALGGKTGWIEQHVLGQQPTSPSLPGAVPSRARRQRRETRPARRKAAIAGDRRTLDREERSHQPFGRKSVLRSAVAATPSSFATRCEAARCEISRLDLSDSAFRAPCRLRRRT